MCYTVLTEYTNEYGLRDIVKQKFSNMTEVNFFKRDKAYLYCT